MYTNFTKGEHLLPFTIKGGPVLLLSLFNFRACAPAQVVGRLGEKPAAAGQAVRGVLVKRGMEHTLMHAEDLPQARAFYFLFNF